MTIAALTAIASKADASANVLRRGDILRTKVLPLFPEGTYLEDISFPVHNFIVTLVKNIHNHRAVHFASVEVG